MGEEGGVGVLVLGFGFWIVGGFFLAQEEKKPESEGLVLVEEARD